jgi:large subunit ribosomal protein L18
MRTSVLKHKNALRTKRKFRVRKKISGVETKPRVTVFKSNKYFYAQAIDDVKGFTLAYSDGHKMGLKNNKEDVKQIASDLAGKLKENGIEAIVFDKNGYLYHGVVKSFADALRENGIKF